MKIAVDCHSLEKNNYAGKEQYLFNFLLEISKIDNKNTYILYFKNPNQFFNNIKIPNNWKVKKLKTVTPLWHFYILFRMVFIDKVDFLFSPNSYLLVALNIFKPNGIVIHDLISFIPRINNNHKLSTCIIEKMILGRAIKNSSVIFVVSKNTKKDLYKFFPSSVSKKVIISYAAPQIFKNKSLEKNSVFKKFGIKSKYIFFTGTIEPRKNIKGLIKSFYYFTKKQKNYILVISGARGWGYNDVFDLVKKLDLQGKIIFTNYVSSDELKVLYSNSSCFIYLSFYEGFGIPPLEAMRCGVPVIVSDNSSLSEIVADGGVLVDPYNHKEISDKLLKIVSDKNYYNSLIKKGKKRAEYFSWNKTANIILKNITNKI